MQRITRCALRATAAAGSAAALMFLMAGPASAAPGDANSSAFGLSANVLAGAVNVPPTPTSTYPPGSSRSTISANLGALGSTGVLKAVTNGDANGNSSATGSAARVALLGGAVPSLPAITARLISASCTADGTGTPTGSSTFTAATLGTNAIAVHPAANTRLIDISLLLRVTVNEQTTSAGGTVLTVNALHVQVGPIVNGVASLGDVIIGHAVCGPNTPVLGSPIFTSVFYVGFGAIAVVILGAYLVRRRTSALPA